MQNSKAIYLLRKLQKQLLIDGCEEISTAVGLAADSLSSKNSAINAAISHKSENIPIVGRSCDHLTGVVGALKSLA